MSNVTVASYQSGNNRINNGPDILLDSYISGRFDVTVSPKGQANGKSRLMNGGSDFGPDTLLGAAAPGQYGPPFTKSSGIFEMINYCLGQAAASGTATTPEMVFQSGIYDITDSATFSPSANIAGVTFRGCGQNGFIINITNVTGYCMTFDATKFTACNWHIKGGFGTVVNNSSTCDGFMKIDYSVSGATAYSSSFVADAIQLGTNLVEFASNPLYLNQFNSILIDNLFDYNNISGQGGGIGSLFVAHNIGIFGGWCNDTFYVGGTNCITIIEGLYNIQSIACTADGANFLVVKNSFFTQILVNPSGYIDNVYLDNIVQNATNTVLITSTNSSTANIGRLVINGLRYNNTAYTDFYTLLGFSSVKMSNVVAVGTSATQLLQNSPATPTIPASGTAVTNTNNYPVIVNIYGGTVTNITKTPNGGNGGSTHLQVSNNTPCMVILMADDQILIDYTSAPTWIWQDGML